MDISKIVLPDELYSLSILAPGKTEPLGITVMLRSAGSDAAMSVVRRQTDEALARSQRRIAPDADWIEKNELEQAVAYVASWDWAGEAEWKGVKPDCTPEMVAEVFREAPWLYAQVVGAARDIANFTKA